MAVGVSRGQLGQGGGWLRLGRGTGVFEIVVTWPVCLSVCRWMSSMWPVTPPPPPTLSSPEVRALIAGQEARMEGFSGHPRPTPKNLHVGLTQHLLAPAPEKCNVKPWGGRGVGQSKQRAQGRTDEPGQHGTMINPCLLTPHTFDPFGFLKVLYYNDIFDILAGFICDIKMC